MLPCICCPVTARCLQQTNAECGHDPAFRRYKRVINTQRVAKVTVAIDCE